MKLWVSIAVLCAAFAKTALPGAALAIRIADQSPKGFKGGVVATEQ